MHRKYYCPPHPYIQYRHHPWPPRRALHLPGGDEGEGGDAGGRPQVAQAPHVQVQYGTVNCMVQYHTVVEYGTWYRWLKLHMCRIACVLFVLLCVAGACIASLVWWINDETSGLSR